MILTGRYYPPRAIEVCWHYGNWTNARCILFYQRRAVMTYHISEYPIDRHMEIKYKQSGFSMAGKIAIQDWNLWRTRDH